MGRSRQISFLPKLKSRSGRFGGTLHGKGNPKTARNESFKTPMHITLKSSRAVGDRSFLLHAREIEKILRDQARHFHIDFIDGANAGNHLHILLRLRRQKSLGRYLRSVTGLISRRVLRAQRGSPSQFLERLHEQQKKFWDARPFSRIVSYSDDFRGMLRYMQINRSETAGLSRQTARAMVAQIAELVKAGRIPAVAGFL